MIMKKMYVKIKPLNEWFYLFVGVRRMEDKKEELKYQIDAMRRIRKDAGMNRREFSEYMDIPLRTLEEWEAGRRKMPDYVLRLIAYQIRMEKFLSEKGIEVRGEDTYGEN